MYVISHELCYHHLIASGEDILHFFSAQMNFVISIMSSHCLDYH